VSGFSRTLSASRQPITRLKPSRYVKRRKNMRRIAAWTSILGAVAALATTGVRGQDPDGGANRGRPLAAYRPSVPGVHGLVTAGHPLAAMAGLQVLMKGGTAMDAAVAVGAALNMMEPQMNGVGGNGFMTVYDKKSGRVYSLAMAGAAPKAIKGDAMTPETLDWGVNAGIVPGNFGGYLIGLERFGTMSLADVFAPAIDYAAHGYPIDPSLATAIARARTRLAQFPSTAKVFLPGGRPPEAGELFRNPDLAATLSKAVEAEQTALKQKKPRADAIEAAFARFYKGDIAQEFDRFFKENHGSLTAADMAAYRPEWQEPVHVTYRGYDVYSNPATSRGGIELAMQLNLIEGFDLAKMGANSPEALHLLIEAIKVAKADVYRYVADPKFTKIPMAGMLSKAYATERRKLIQPRTAMAYPAAGEPARFAPSTAAGAAALLLRPPAGPAFADEYEMERDTTSFSIVDQYGNAVACTPTLGGGFGAGVVVGNTGLLLNNGIRLGSTSPYPENVNYVRGGQTPLLNNSPGVVLKDGRVAMVFGTPGGETIGQTEFQMLVNVIDFHMPVQQAVENPRFALDAKPNFYKPGSQVSVTMERRVSAAALRALGEWGHTIVPTSDFTAAVGGMQAIVVDLQKGTMTAGADPRRTGYAVGW
jgi:gamma-glutamyltranspeptidase / glutathione hydrolase